MSSNKGQARDTEYRANPWHVELRSGGSRRIGGYAAKFDSMSKLLPGGFYEKVNPAAFSMSRGTGYAGVTCRYDHGEILGSIRGGNLTLTIDRVGLDYECDVAETRCGDDTLALVRRNDLGGSSFAFSVVGDEGDAWEHQGGVLVRHLLSVQLRDVSPCGTPAYDDATVSLRSLARQVDAPLDDVQYLANNNQLLKLFSRSDIDGGGPKSMAGKQAVVATLALTPQAGKSLTDEQRTLEELKAPMSGRDALLKTLQMRWSAPPQRTRLRKELTDMRYPSCLITEIAGED